MLKAWEGLGYYTRARNLQKLAREVVEKGGLLPTLPEELVKLSGIGPYTAGAVASLAFGQRAALVDGNVMRVFARVFNCRDNIAERATQQAMWLLAKELLPDAGACARHNSALMELGATVCTPAKPQCLLCPLQSICQAEEPEKLPIKSKTTIEQREERIAIIQEKGCWWLEPGPKRGRLAGFWRFPEFVEETMNLGSKVAEFTYGITRYRIRLTAHAAQWKGLPSADGRWFTPAELEQTTLAAAQGRLRKLIMSE